MTSILFPTDFSENSKHAFRFAKAMVRARKAKLILLYVYDLPLVAPLNVFTTREQTLALIDRSLRDAAREHMKEFTDELDLMDDEYEVIIKDGHVADEIISFCKRESTELIIMGTKGKTNQRDFLMGSNTVKVIQKTSTPLLAIPESARVKPFSNIVFATDLIYNTDKELSKIVAFAEKNKASLTFLHLSLHKEAHSKELKELGDFIQQNPYKKLSLVIKHTKNVADGLIAYLNEGQTDLMALSNHTKSIYEKLFHKSISREMVLKAQVPLLIFSKEVHPIVFF